MKFVLRSWGTIAKTEFAGTRKLALEVVNDLVDARDVGVDCGNLAACLVAQRRWHASVIEVIE